MMTTIVSHPRPVFVIGNKRSGTSLLVSLLNAHSGIFIAPESDIVWLLYQCRREWPGEYERYQWDGGVGLRRTLELCATVLERHASARTVPQVPQLFSEMQAALMSSWCASHPGVTKPHVVWWGDKKPVQQCDPVIRPFLAQHFPAARYLHIVRHPRRVIASSMAAAREWSTGVPPYWSADPDRILYRWTLHEQWVLDAKNSDRWLVHSLRLEDLVRSPAETLRRALEFLELENEDSVDGAVREVQAQSRRDRAVPNLRFSVAARRIMDQYGYTEDDDVAPSTGSRIQSDDGVV